MSVVPAGTRRVAIAVAGLALAASLAACTSTSADGGSGSLAGSGSSPAPVASGAPAPSGAPSTPVGTGKPAGAPSTGSTKPATHAYPSDYAAAILGAWKAHDTAYLTQLTSAAIANQLYGYGNINQTWTALPAQGAAGSTFAQFYNAAGDWINIQIGNEATSEHQWHAGRISEWDKMTFPTDPVVYAKHFVVAWQNGNVARMKLLGSASLASQFQAMTQKPGPDFTATGDGAMGHTYVEIKDPDDASIDITLEVSNQQVGHAGAIEPSSGPSPPDQRLPC